MAVARANAARLGLDGRLFVRRPARRGRSRTTPCWPTCPTSRTAPRCRRRSRATSRRARCSAGPTAWTSIRRLIVRQAAGSDLLALELGPEQAGAVAALLRGAGYAAVAGAARPGGARAGRRRTRRGHDRAGRARSGLRALHRGRRGRRVPGRHRLRARLRRRRPPRRRAAVRLKRRPAGQALGGDVLRLRAGAGGVARARPAHSRGAAAAAARARSRCCCPTRRGASRWPAAPIRGRWGCGCPVVPALAGVALAGAAVERQPRRRARRAPPRRTCRPRSARRPTS